MKESQFRKVLSRLSATRAHSATPATYELTDEMGGTRKPNRNTQPTPPHEPVPAANPPVVSHAIASLDWKPLVLRPDGLMIQINASLNLAGQMVFIGLAHPSEELAHSKISIPTPFYRAFRDALAVQDPESRARAFLALAAGLSPGGAVPLRETCTHNADISVRRLPPGQERERLFALVELMNTAAPGTGDVTPTAEPPCETGNYRGRFAVLRAVGAETAVARLPSAPFLELAEQGWLPVSKVLFSPAEVEVAPGLLRRSLVEALHRDPDCLESWRTWLAGQLLRNPSLWEELKPLLGVS